MKKVFCFVICLTNTLSDENDLDSHKINYEKVNIVP